jgi:hypothetical protein
MRNSLLNPQKIIRHCEGSIRLPEAISFRVNGIASSQKTLLAMTKSNLGGVS